jgi:hypothetical protein
VKAFAVGLLVLSLQAPASTTLLSSLAGRWITTVVPPAGEAPMIEPSFTLEVQSGKALVTFEGSKAAKEASVLTSKEAADDVAVLIIKYPASSASTRTVMIRPIALGQLRVEEYFESTDGRPGGSFYVAEVFRKSK